MTYLVLFVEAKESALNFTAESAVARQIGRADL
jgi:hypothetical protein